MNRQKIQIVARIPNPISIAKITALQQLGLEGKRRQRGIDVYLDNPKGLKFIVPDFRNMNILLFIEAYEQGGGDVGGRTGWAQVVAGIKGWPLHGAIFSGKDTKPNGIHAIFPVFSPSVIVTAQRMSEGPASLYIHKCGITRDGQEAQITLEELWRGTEDEPFPPRGKGKELWRYEKVLVAGIRKINTPNCREAFFFAQKKAS